MIIMGPGGKKHHFFLVSTPSLRQKGPIIFCLTLESLQLGPRGLPSFDPQTCFLSRPCENGLLFLFLPGLFLIHSFKMILFCGISLLWLCQPVLAQYSS